MNKTASIPTTIKIIIADDHPFYLEGVKQVLQSDPQFEVIAAVSNGQDLVTQTIALAPDILIVDISMPILNGIQALKKLKEEGIHFKAIALTMHTEDHIILQILNAGAMGYLDKNVSKTELFEAIHSVVHFNKVYFPSTISQHMLELLQTASYKPYPEPVNFTDKEVEIIKLIVKDFSTKEISQKLALSPRTIDTHRARMMERMGVKSVAGLVAFAYSKGMV